MEDFQRKKLMEWIWQTVSRTQLEPGGGGGGGGEEDGNTDSDGSCDI